MEENKGIELNKKKIEISFRKFSDYSQDLLNASYNTFDSRIKILVHYCENDAIMKVIVSQLKAIDFNFDSWWDKVLGTIGGMVGSGNLELPLEEDKRDACLYQMLLRVADGRLDVVTIASNFLSTSSKLDICVNDFNEAVIHPLVRSIKYKLEEITDNVETKYHDVSSVPLQVLFVYQDFSTSVGDKNNFKGDFAAGGGKIE